MWVIVTVVGAFWLVLVYDLDTIKRCGYSVLALGFLRVLVAVLLLSALIITLLGSGALLGAELEDVSTCEVSSPSVNTPVSTA